MNNKSRLIKFFKIAALIIFWGGVFAGAIYFLQGWEDSQNRVERERVKSFCEELAGENVSLYDDCLDQASETF